MSQPILRKNVIVTNPEGFHARPAAELAQLARQFRSEVRVHKGDQVADGRSVLELLTLGAVAGTELIVEVRGPDASEVLPLLVEAVNSLPVPVEE